MDIPAQVLTRKAIVLACAYCLIAFATVVAVIHFSLPDRLKLYADMRSEKIALMESSQACSAAFGSSHIHYGFDPRAFDATLDNTMATHTINLGVGGGSQVEQRVLAMKFARKLDAHSAQNCFLLLELDAGVNFNFRFLVHPRTINVYDADAVRFVKSLTPLSLGLRRVVGRMGYALLASVMYYSNTGMESNRIFPPDLNAQAIQDESRNDRRGLLTPIEPLSKLDQVRRELTSTEPLHKEVFILPQGVPQLADEIASQAHVPNLHIAYVVFPRAHDVSSQSEFPDSIPTRCGVVPIFNMAQPAKYPDIYVVQNWADDAHLSEAGASITSRHLAEQLNAWFTVHPQPMECH
ncbi:hypothetical protein FTW19_23980 [Terriglobus albidus]|uniref:Uncharacterized protein n=1 Tax=Terriglobus albidus TaxID=1592106 RepID=A0A5B9EFH5_9BACT|nr:hypothetical protein [Terriglobus albidus]QEE30788.1 hypothetical protein FTW19_23980 [Terriglobus albidus]